MNNLTEQRQVIDNLIDKHAENVSCRIGCCHCCYYEVVITDEEADILADLILNGEVKIDVALLKKHKEFGQESLPYEEKRCVFLSDSGFCNV